MSTAVTTRIECSEIEKVLFGNDEVFFLHVLHAFSSLSLGTKQGADGAKLSLNNAKRIESWSSPWEASYFTIGQLVLKKKYTQALAYLERHLLEWPHDLFALKCVELVSYLRGELVDLAWIEKIVERSFFSCQENSFYAAFYGRILFLRGDHSRALKVLEKGMEHPIGKLTRLELLLKAGQIHQAATFVESVESHFLSSFFLLHVGTHSELSGIVSTVCSTAGTVKEKIQGLTLLVALDLRGVQVEWDHVHPLIESDFDPFLIPFVTGVRLYYLEKTGNNGLALYSSILDVVRSLEGEERTVWDKIGIPFLEAIRSAAHGKKETLFSLMRTNEFAPLIGGGTFEHFCFRNDLDSFCSHSQNDEGKNS